MIRYSEQLKEVIRQEYKANEMGYKRLAKKYDLTRDAVRTIIKSSKAKEAEGKAMSKEKIEKDLEYYKTAALFWETHAKRLESKYVEKAKKKEKGTGALKIFRNKD